jgi:hypothetical protein
MVLGLPLHTFTVVHVAISLVGIASGVVVVLGMLTSMRLNAITALFLLTTVLTSLTGYLFPFHGVTPAIIVGALSLIALLGAIQARYQFRLAGKSRWVYVITSVVALWFNVFVLIVQSFQKVPALNALAPDGNEPPFLIAQVIVMLVFIVLGVLAVKKFHPAPAAAA